MGLRVREHHLSVVRGRVRYHRRGGRESAKRRAQGSRRVPEQSENEHGRIGQTGTARYTRPGGYRERATDNHNIIIKITAASYFE